MSTTSPVPVPSRSLMIRYIGGDDRAFSTLVARFEPRIRRLILRRLRNKDLADDLVQRTLLRVHSSRRLFVEDRNADSERSVEAWFLTTARRTLLDHMRADYRRTARIKRLSNHYDTAGFGAPRPSQDPEQIASEAEHTLRRRESVRLAMKTLPPAAREIIERHKIEGQSMSAIAGELEVEVGTLRVRAHRAYRKLAAALATPQALPSASRRASEHTG